MEVVILIKIDAVVYFVSFGASLLNMHQQEHQACKILLQLP